MKIINIISFNCSLILLLLFVNCVKTTYYYYPDGKVRIGEISYKSDVLSFKNFSPDGKLASEDHYLNRKRHGRCTRYYCQDGTVKYECVFKNGKPYNGIWPASIEGITEGDNSKYLDSINISFDNYGISLESSSIVKP